jgi:DNA-binding transcriptional LysR family regulator
MELRHLRYFIAVAEELNFSHAAAKLCIAQPPLSAQIKALEAELGFPLFIRTKKIVKLSLPGRAFLPRAKEVIASASVVTDSAQQIAKGRRGVLKIGIAPLLPRQSPQGSRSSTNCIPMFFLVVQQGGARPLRRKLEAMELDIIFTLKTSLRIPTMNVLELERREQFLAIPDEHPLAGKDTIQITDLSGFRLLLID